jgi:hypothetical protein
VSIIIYSETNIHSPTSSLTPNHHHLHRGLKGMKMGVGWGGVLDLEWKIKRPQRQDESPCEPYIEAVYMYYPNPTS